MATTFTPEFADFVRDTEPRLRRALVATWGPELGREATAEALVYAWSNWDRVSGMDNPGGYLYVVGKRSVKPPLPPPPLQAVPDDHEPWVEPHLDVALATLTDPQRVSVVLHHSFAWTYGEVAGLLEVSVSTVRNHIGRGMEKLRSVLEVSVDG